MERPGPRDSEGFKTEPAKLHQFKEDLNPLPCFLSVRRLSLQDTIPPIQENGLIHAPSNSRGTVVAVKLTQINEILGTSESPTKVFAFLYTKATRDLNFQFSKQFPILFLTDFPVVVATDDFSPLLQTPSSLDSNQRHNEALPATFPVASSHPQHTLDPWKTAGFSNHSILPVFNAVHPQYHPPLSFVRPSAPGHPTHWSPSIHKSMSTINILFLTPNAQDVEGQPFRFWDLGADRKVGFP
ncbi:hypothetical protein PAL_GLEAN10012875 [Pteropus alecto]|uniref:Uncharacterized protein n=1 Tax=Pteropus alecto TaxID=9402 RepID=L5KRN3_PTEAL|nr:hypothetical protein PAL_GLEAN10012875 [Pteropus alecto]